MARTVKAPSTSRRQEGARSATAGSRGVPENNVAGPQSHELRPLPPTLGRLLRNAPGSRSRGRFRGPVRPVAAARSPWRAPSAFMPAEIDMLPTDACPADPSRGYGGVTPPCRIARSCPRSGDRSRHPGAVHPLRADRGVRRDHHPVAHGDEGEAEIRSVAAALVAWQWGARRRDRRGEGTPAGCFVSRSERAFAGFSRRRARRGASASFRAGSPRGRRRRAAPRRGPRPTAGGRLRSSPRPPRPRSGRER
jgi:hypothetical protein